MTGCIIRSHKTIGQLEECVRLSAVPAKFHIQPSADIRPWEGEDFRALLQERKYCKSVVEERGFENWCGNNCVIICDNGADTKLKEIDNVVNFG